MSALIVILCVILNAIVSGTSVDYGMQARTLQKDQLQLVLQRKELEAVLAEATSLNQLRKEAEMQGFLPARTIVYASSLPVALS